MTRGCFSKCEVPDGGLVPKSLYRTAEELESEENHLLTDSIYKSASIFKAAPFEVPCPSRANAELYCFILWVMLPSAGGK